MAAHHPAVFLGEPRERRIRIGLQRWDTHHPEQGQSRRAGHLIAQCVDAGGIVDVDPAARNVAVQAELDINAERTGAPAVGVTRAAPRSNAATTRALLTECTVCAHAAIDLALLRWI